VARSQDYKKESGEFFAFNADCVADAERNGYKLKTVRVQGPAAPGARSTWDLAYMDLSRR
jgi:hypothetical protein